LDSGVYRILSNIDGKGYIGITGRSFYERQWEHRYELKRQTHCNPYLQAAWNKNGEENFIFEILEVCPKELLKERELYWVEFYHTLERDFGYNIEIPTDPPQHSKVTREKIGLSKIGKRRSLEVCKKISISRTGYRVPTEIKNKISFSTSGEKNHFYGKHHSEKSCEKIREKKIGKKPSEKTKAKLSECRTGENNPKAKLTWEKVAEIREEYGVTVANIWKIVENRTWKI
jgi:group I intron endonuclease